MESYKYYDVKDIVRSMDIAGYPTEKIYICQDTNDFWISRVKEGINADYNKADKVLVERNKFDIFEVMEKLNEMTEKEVPKLSERVLEAKNFINSFDIETICKAVIALDDENGCENWDNYEVDTMQEAVELIDDGFGILEI